MASEKLFRDIAPFPDDITTASMPTISLANLHSGHEATAKSLLAACQELGFFFLDLQGDELGETLVDEIDQLFALNKDLLNLPDDVKNQYLHDIPKSFLGTEKNEPDRYESFNIGQDGLMGNTPLQPLPPSLQPSLPLIKSFLKHGQSIVATISSILASQIGLPPETFTSLQVPTKPSGTVIRFLKTFASPAEEDLRTSLIHHSDFGTITLLANVLGGLQLLAPGKDPADESAWLWVKPRPGCLIVNIGDAMAQWTGGLLRSSLHRIRHAPGQQRFSDRYSLALLTRPERDASMKRLVGGDQDDENANLTAWEWEVKKAMAMKRGTE
ncbi:hypothetical protein DL765_003304 [Monosporascus sp. GIB2]|nr:hypothetical protein DL765_003304 [Monosporascus sp. GIB2]